jgi:plasmid replication initiation protein
MNKDYIVTKSNKLINCDYNLSLQEQKIILTLASMVQPQDTEFKEYEFKIKDFIQLLGLKTQTKYTELPKITKELKKKVFEIKEGKDLIQVSWLGGVRYKTGEGILILSLDKGLKPYMLGLKEFYISYKLENVLSLKSKYSIRLYEVLKSNLFKKCIEVEIVELKKMLGVNEKSYNVYQNLKNKVIITAQKELNKITDIKFEFEEIKTGRKVTSLKFIIHSKDKAKREIAATTEMLSDDLIKQVQSICYKHKIKANEASGILKDANNNIDLIKQCYEYLLNKDNIKNIVGYMRKLVKGFDEPQSNNKIDRFNNFEQRTYDFEKLENKLLGW